MSCDQDTALNTLRTTKYALNVDTSLFTTTGRSSGNNIIFKSNNNPNAPTYEEYKMRRKAEVLKYKNSNNENNNNKFSYANIARGNGTVKIKQNSTQNFILTDANINNLTRRNNSLILTSSSREICNFNRKIFKSARNSGVPSNDLLFEDVNVPFQTSL
tara:strand:- start:109 stop:585 length:477 start_codon:yes stop_codon:yes gene_type:complete